MEGHEDKQEKPVKNTQSGRTRVGITLTTGLTQTGGRMTGAQNLWTDPAWEQAARQLPSTQPAQEQTNRTQGGSRLHWKASRSCSVEALTGKRRTPAEEKVLGFYDISRAHFHSPASRRIVMKVQKRTTSVRVVAQCWTKPCMERRTLAQCFDVASENAMTAMDAAWQVGRLVCIIRAQLPCLCSDTVTTLCCGARGHNKKIEEQMSNHLIVKHLATLGPCTALGY